MSESEICISVQRKVTIQPNGIIRNAANGIIIGRLNEGIKFDLNEVQDKLVSEEDLGLWEVIMKRMGLS